MATSFICLISLLSNVHMVYSSVQVDLNVLMENCTNRKPSKYSIISTKTVRSKIHCSFLCRQKFTCRLFTFSSNTKQCNLSWEIPKACEYLDVSENSDMFELKKSTLKDYKYYFPMDDIIDDLVIGDIDITSYNNPTLTDGVNGKALSFNGIDQWADLGIHTCFTDISQCSNGYSMAAWLKVPQWMLNTDGADKYIISSGGQTTEIITAGMAVLTKSGNLLVIFRIRSTTEIWQKDDITVQPDLWFHLIVTWKKFGNLTIFINGDQKGARSAGSYSPGNALVSSAMLLGKPNNADANYGEVEVDEWFFWDYELNSHQVFVICTIHNLC